MNFDLFDRRSAERFAELLDESDGGRRHHTRGPADAQLAELVAVGHKLSAAPPGVMVDSEFRVGLRAMLLATAERDGIGATATVIDDDHGVSAAAREPGRSLPRIAGSSRRIRARTAIVIGVAAGAMAVSGISAASESASPGDALYGVKRSTERAQLAMAGSSVSRGQLSLDFARTRLTEAAAIPGDDPEFGRVLDDMDADTRQGVKLLTGAAVARTDAAPLAIVDDFGSEQRSAFAPMLDRLSPANRERARESMTLLEAVTRRAAVLRADLACGSTMRSGSDALGPKLKDCAEGTGHTSTDRVDGTGSTENAKPGTIIRNQVRPERTDPAVAPTGAVVPGDQPTAPAAAPGATQAPAPDAPSPSSSSTPPDDGGGLGGLLGKLLGG